jgi:hypothetical protein
MTDPENFLSRWARKKRDAAEDAAPGAGVSGNGSLPAEAAVAYPPVSPVNTEPPELPEPPFDPASLPSLDSIGAQTDIRAFLQANVPPDLVRAALRRAWTADPVIRNFKGLQENDWDFNDPNSMFGFGELGPDFDVKRMLASVFGEGPKETESPSTADEVAPESAPVANEEPVIKDRQQVECAQTLPGINDGTAKGLDRTDATSSASVAAVDTVGVVADAATQQATPASNAAPSIRTRRHGGALPR